MERLGITYVGFIKHNTEIIKREDFLVRSDGEDMLYMKYRELDLWSNLDEKIKLKYSGVASAHLKLYKLWIEGDSKEIFVITFLE